MNFKKIAAVIISAAIILSLCIIPVSANVNTVRVNSVDALMSAIASDTKIIVEPGKYIIPTITRYFDDFSYEEAQYLYISQINNLEIVGEGSVEIALDAGWMPVIVIRESSNITINNLILGHNVPEFSCEGEGDVISIESSNNITVNNCDMYGCGIVGIYASGSADITVNNSTIRDCANAALDAWNMNGNMTFNNCSFLRNAYDTIAAEMYSCFQFYGSSENSVTEQLIFNNCTIQDNLNNKGFKTDESAEIIHNNSYIANNYWESAITVRVAYSNGSYDYEYDVSFSDQKPVIVDGRTMIPARGLFEELYYNVEWNDSTRTVVITDGTDTVEIPIDSNTLYKNGQAITTDVPAQIINDRTMIPVRAISEAFGLDVEWNGETRTVLIKK